MGGRWCTRDPTSVNSPPPSPPGANSYLKTSHATESLYGAKNWKGEESARSLEREWATHRHLALTLGVPYLPFIYQKLLRLTEKSVAQPTVAIMMEAFQGGELSHVRWVADDDEKDKGEWCGLDGGLEE